MYFVKEKVRGKWRNPEVLGGSGDIAHWTWTSNSPSFLLYSRFSYFHSTYDYSVHWSSRQYQPLRNQHVRQFLHSTWPAKYTNKTPRLSGRCVVLQQQLRHWDPLLSKWHMYSVRPNVPKGIDRYRSQQSSLKRAACMFRPLFAFLADHLGADFSCYSPICCTSWCKSSAKSPDTVIYVPNSMQRAEHQCRVGVVSR